MFSHTVGSPFILMLFSFLLLIILIFIVILLMLFSLAMQKKVPLQMKKVHADEVPFVYSFLYVPHSRGHISEDVALWNV